MEGILAVANTHKLPVIEDCAHALFGEWRGRYARARSASVGVFSFNSSKHVSTGDGGMAVTNDAYLNEQMRAIITFGAAPVRVANNYRMTELTAAVARVQMRRARGYVAEDRASAQLYSAAVDGCDVAASAAGQRGQRSLLPSLGGSLLAPAGRSFLGGFQGGVRCRRSRV